MRVALLFLAFLLVRPAAAASPPWTPPPGVPFDIQLQGPVRVNPGTGFIEVDLFDTPVSSVAALKGQRLHVACYVDAGTAEAWRPDYGRWPSDLLGKPLPGYPDERWLDIRAIGRLAPVIAARVRLCRAKGFDAIDFDNIDGFENDTGFPLTADDAVRFAAWLAGLAHARGLPVAMKNALPLVPRLVDRFDWAVNESCFTYAECGLLRPFVERGKAVFVIEYARRADLRRRYCGQARDLGVELIFKRPSLRQDLARCS